MSSSRKRTEHIERTRYPNPLPPPPYPPKLLSIPTPTSRYADPRTFGMRLAQSHPLPMVVDAEAGMPLNMTDFPQAWYTDQELEAGDDVFAKLAPDAVIDDEDAYLLSDLLAKVPTTSNGVANGVGAKAGQDRANVTWLRRTEYLGAEQAKRKAENMAQRGKAEVIDASREAQIARIKASFEAANMPLQSIKHPTKPSLQAVDSYSLFPDPDTWATRFDVFRFGDPPGRVMGGKARADPRLEVAVLRPHQDVLDETIYSLFLNRPAEEEVEQGDDENPRKKRVVRSAEEEQEIEDAESARVVQSRLKGMRRDADANHGDADEFDAPMAEDPTSRLAYVRDYLPHDETNRKDQELVFTFVDQPSSVADETGPNQSENGCLPPLTEYERRFRRQQAGPSSRSQQKVAYYHPVSSRAQLRVRRRKATETQPPDHWDVVDLGKRALSTYEKIERLYERAEVDNFGEEDLPERIVIQAAEEEEIEGDEVAEADGNAEAVAAAIQEAPDEGVGDNTDRPMRQGIESDDDEQGAAPAPKAERAIGSTAERQDEADSDDGDKEEGSGAGSDSDSGSGSNEEEDVDEDELAFLRADAGDDVEMDDEDGEDTGRARRSRRGMAAAAAAEESEALRQQQRARNRELGGDEEED